MGNKSGLDKCMSWDKVYFQTQICNQTDKSWYMIKVSDTY